MLTLPAATDPQWILQVTERMDVVQRKFTDVLMTKRLQTLQSIDEAIERLCNQLAAIGELENTYVFYTSGIHTHWLTFIYIVTRILIYKGMFYKNKYSILTKKEQCKSTSSTQLQ